MATTQGFSLESSQSVELDRLANGLLDAIGALVVVIDTEGCVVFFNRACERASGCDREDVVGRPFVDFLTNSEESEEVAVLHDGLLDEPAAFDFEHSWVGKDGKRRRIRWTAAYVEDENRSPYRIVATGIDLTRRRQLEHEIISADERLRRRFGQELHDMLASHLAGTAMMASALTRRREKGTDVTVSDLRSLTELVREGAEQVRTLSHSFVAPEMESENLADALNTLADRTEATAGIDCECFVCPAARQARPASETATHLIRIAQEALHNATTHADPTSVSVSLAQEKDPAVGDVLVLSVRDNGCGIPERVAPGVGLANMRRRAQMIGASLCVRGAESGGTLVKCVVPMS